jgi:hypothetical protein
MTKPDYRALCEELIQQLHELHTMVWGEAPHLLDEDRGGSAYLDLDIEDVLKKARAALAAQPEPAELTDEDLYDLAEVFNGEPVAAMRRALEIWGTPAIQPVPVSERLPGPEDCDEEGRCWWWNVTMDPDSPNWSSLESIEYIETEP